MSAVLSKPAKGEKAGGSAPKSSDSSRDALTSANARAMPAYALGGDVSPALSLFGGQPQMKLSVGQPDDPAEHEADEVADTVADPNAAVQREAAQEGEKRPEETEEERVQPVVLRAAAAEDEEPAAEEAESAEPAEQEEEPERPPQEALLRKPDSDRWKREKGEHEKREHEEHERPQRPPSDGDSATPEGGLPRIPKQGGQPLPDAHRFHFEQTLGHGFEHVKVHTTPPADRAARQLGAGAFTIGHDIYFRSGAYAPGTPQGDRVLAHELTHVIQQDEGRVPRPSSKADAVSQPTDPLEAEAY